MVSQQFKEEISKMSQLLTIKILKVKVKIVLK